MAAICWAAALVAGVMALMFWNALRTERELNAELAVRVAALQRERVPDHVGVQPSAAGPAALSSSANAQGASIDGVSLSDSPPSMAAREGERRTDPMLTMLRDMVSRPEGQEFQRVMSRQMLAREHPDLSNALGISAADAERVLDLLARQRTEIGAARLAMQNSGARDQAAMEEQGRLIYEKEQAYEAEMAALLGSNYDKWKQYERGAGERRRQSVQRQQVDQLRVVLTADGHTLGEAQLESLMTALRAEQQQIDRESGRLSMQRQLQRLPESNARLANVAAAHLDPVQLERYRKHLAQQAQMASAVMGIVTEVGGPEAPGTAPVGSD